MALYTSLYNMLSSEVYEVQLGLSLSFYEV